MSDYPSGLTLRPIEQWPGVLTTTRVRSQFSAPWKATLQLLDRELWHLGPGNRNAPAVLQIAMREKDFRQDGLPRANSRPDHPGVILAIESTKGPLSFPCDKFTTWQDNLRAIALALEALRKIDRYGITPGDEQYTGWKQLGAAPSPAATTSADEALKVVLDLAGPADDLSLNTWPQQYRRARANAHPDRHDGDRTQWDRLEAAADRLKKAGRL